MVKLVKRVKWSKSQKGWKSQELSKVHWIAFNFENIKIVILLVQYLYSYLGLYIHEIQTEMDKKC